MEKNEEYGIEGITVSMAIVDAIPVLLFIGIGVVVSILFKSAIFSVGALMVAIGGITKVTWKFLLSLFNKNVFWLNKCMKYFMISGFGIIILSLIIDNDKIVISSVIAALTGFPQIIFFIIGLIGMGMMFVFAKKLDPSNAKSNWIEQCTNSVAQCCFFIGMLIILL